jgi:hypothetical protein
MKRYSDSLVSYLNRYKDRLKFCTSLRESFVESVIMSPSTNFFRRAGVVFKLNPQASAARNCSAGEGYGFIHFSTVTTITARSFNLLVFLLEVEICRA